MWRWFLALLLIACGGDDSDPTLDAGPGVDAGGIDAAGTDAAGTDAGGFDAGPDGTTMVEGCDLGADESDPSVVADLTLSATRKAPQLHMRLTWTAPVGAATYDIRMSSSPITSEAEFDAATALTAERTAGNALPAPSSAGSTESVEVIGLSPRATYHFAVVALDAGGARAALCNAPARATATFGGYGAEATGGGEGTICRVTTTDDSGAGSLRACLTTPRDCSREPLYVAFDVGGTITLMTDITIREDDCNLTIDGSTAPDPGITIRKRACPIGLTSCPAGTPCVQDGEFKVGVDRATATDDVVLTHLRFRGNYDIAWGGCSENSGATLGIQYHFGNLVLDHLTIRNGVDSAPDLWSGGHDSGRVTIAHTLMAWSNHPLTISDSGGAGSRDAITIHHSVIARSHERMPQIRYDTTNVDFRNNVVFDWEAGPGGSYGTRIQDDPPARVSANIVNNVWIPGDGRARTAFVYGDRPGSDSVDGGPSSCTPSDNCAGCPAQGDVVATTNMGEIWVAGNRFPPGSCEKWSTVSTERAVPRISQVGTDPVDEVVSNARANVGTHFRTSDEQALLDEMAGM